MTCTWGSGQTLTANYSLYYWWVPGAGGFTCSLVGMGSIGMALGGVCRVQGAPSLPCAGMRTGRPRWSASSTCGSTVCASAAASSRVRSSNSSPSTSVSMPARMAAPWRSPAIAWSCRTSVRGGVGTAVVLRTVGPPGCEDSAHRAPPLSCSETRGTCEPDHPQHEQQPAAAHLELSLPQRALPGARCQVQEQQGHQLDGDSPHTAPAPGHAEPALTTHPSSLCRSRR